MTSKINIIVPACLFSLLLSLAFFNVAYADDEIWRESNNLYNGSVTEFYDNQLSYPYRLYILRNNSSLEPGTYSVSFNQNSSTNTNDMLIIRIDGQSNFSSFNDVITFTLPQDYEYFSVFVESREYIPPTALSDIMLNAGSPLPYEPFYSGFRFDFAAIAQMIGQYVQPVIEMILPYIFIMIALIFGINAGIRVFRKTST